MYFDGYPMDKVADGDWDSSFPSGHTTLAFAGAAFVIWLMPPLVLLMPGVAMWLSSELIERAFRRNMTAEQRREEDERNMDWKNDYEADAPEGGEDKKQKRARKKTDSETQVTETTEALRINHEKEGMKNV